MLPILSSDQIREVERLTMEHQPIAAIDLMEQAGQACADRIKALLERNEIRLTNTSFHVLCGLGNNGGDGLVIARELARAGSNVRVTRIVHGASPSEANNVNWQRLREIGVRMKELREPGSPEIASEEVIIDAILGSGIKRPIEGWLAEVIAAINGFANKIISIDMPSGMPTDLDSGIERSVHIRAEHTFSLEIPKITMMLPRYADAVGELEIVPIGLDTEAMASQHTDHFLIERADAIELLPPRPIAGHKGTFGHALIMAGSMGKVGAAILAVKAALRSGTGLVSANIPDQAIPIMQQAAPEAMCMIEDGSGSRKYESFTAVGIGPGIGLSEDARRRLKDLIQDHDRIVVDADALNILSEERTWLQFLPPNSILTPHPKEFDRLYGSVLSDDTDRLRSAREFAMKHHCILVLKGNRTAICDPTGKVFFNSTGNPGMAKGGSGDALTGLITGLLAQGISSLHAAILGVYLHGLAGDIAANKIGPDGMTVSDLIAAIPTAWKELRSGSEKIFH